jgi:hypothetical protein
MNLYSKKAFMLLEFNLRIEHKDYVNMTIATQYVQPGGIFKLWLPYWKPFKFDTWYTQEQKSQLLVYPPKKAQDNWRT